jgi:hypothetical protein
MRGLVFTLTPWYTYAYCLTNKSARLGTHTVLGTRLEFQKTTDSLTPSPWTLNPKALVDTRMPTTTASKLRY